MNANTIFGFFGGTGRNQIGLQTLASTTETEFKANTDNGVGAIAVLTMPQGNEIVGASNPINPNANSAIIGPDRGSQYGRGLGEQAPWYSNTAFDLKNLGSTFRVRLSGSGAAAAAVGNTILFKIYSGTSKSGTVISTHTAVATASAASLNFIFEVDLQWDSVQQILGGNQRWRITYNGTQPANGFGAGAVLTNAASVTSLANLSFCATATWGNAAGGTIQVNEFSVEAV